MKFVLENESPTLWTLVTNILHYLTMLDEDQYALKAFLDNGLLKRYFKVLFSNYEDHKREEFDTE